mgnify:CR=1 FL=1
MKVDRTKRFLMKAIEKHNGKYDYSKVEYVNAHTKVCIICPIHGEFWVSPANHLHERGCPICKTRQNLKTKYNGKVDFLVFGTKDFMLTDRSGKAAVLAQELGVPYGTNEEAAGCQRVFLGVKPQMMAGVLAPLQPVLTEKKPVLITMAAGLTMESIEKMAEDLHNGYISALPVEDGCTWCSYKDVCKREADDPVKEMEVLSFKDAISQLRSDEDGENVD